MIFKSFYIYYSNLARWRGRWDNSHWSRWQTLYPLAWPPSWEREPRAGGTSPPWAKPPWSTRPPWRRWRKHIWPPARDTMLMTRVYYLQVIYHGFFPFIIISCSLIAQFPDQLLYKITSIYCCVEVTLWLHKLQIIYTVPRASPINYLFACFARHFCHKLFTIAGICL